MQMGTTEVFTLKHNCFEQLGLIANVLIPQVIFNFIFKFPIGEEGTFWSSFYVTLNFKPNLGDRAKTTFFFLVS